MKFVKAFGCILAISIASFAFAGSQFMVCNETSRIVYNAYAMPVVGGYEFAGWYTIKPGQCETFIKYQPDTDFYLYSYDLEPGGNWGITGTHEICVAWSIPFKITIGPNVSCASFGMVAVKAHRFAGDIQGTRLTD